jgi:hypothetical protein
MIDLSLSALIRAWITTMIASGLLVVALALAQFWNNAGYVQGLRQALQITAEEPPPDVMGLYVEDPAIHGTPGEGLKVSRGWPGQARPRQAGNATP